MGEPNSTNIITYTLRCFNKRSVFLIYADIFKLIILLISVQALVSFFCSAFSITCHPFVSSIPVLLCQFSFAFYSPTSSAVTHPAVSVCLSVLIKCLTTDFNRSAFQSTLDVWEDLIWLIPSSFFFIFLAFLIIKNSSSFVLTKVLS